MSCFEIRALLDDPQNLVVGDQPTQVPLYSYVEDRCGAVIGTAVLERHQDWVVCIAKGIFPDAPPTSKQSILQLLDSQGAPVVGYSIGVSTIPTICSPCD